MTMEQKRLLKKQNRRYAFNFSQWSLRQRLIIISSAILLAAFSVIFFATKSAYSLASKNRLLESMSAEVYALMAVADDYENSLYIPDVLRNERLENLSSGLVAYVISANGDLIWQSGSSDLFETHPSQTLDYDLQKLTPSNFENRMMYWVGKQIVWEHESGEEKSYIFIVGERQSILLSAVDKFTSEIIAWLLVAGVLLLVVFIWALNLVLLPLRKAQQQIELVSKGQAKIVEGEFPSELVPLTSSINQLLIGEAKQKNRYRDTLGNLAHSLKTPLAIIKGEIEQRTIIDKKNTLKLQVDRIDDIVKYQLNRSVISSGQTLVRNCLVESEVEKIVSALTKVHARKGLSIYARIEPDVIFPGDAGDLMELVGNLADNACKWTKSQVVISAKYKSNNLCLYVDDDGKGIPEENREQILNRGKRLDQSTEGQGLGLSIVMDIVKHYNGQIFIEDSGLGGALFRVLIPRDSE